MKFDILKFYYKYAGYPSCFYNIETYGAPLSQDTRQLNQRRTNVTETKYTDNRIALTCPGKWHTVVGFSKKNNNS